MPGFLCTNLNIPPGRRIAMKGNLSAGAKSFVVNLGKNKDDFILHFNGRFDAHGDTRTIVCNSKSKGQWGTELRESHFPFQEGSPAEVRPGNGYLWSRFRCKAESVEMVRQRYKRCNKSERLHIIQRGKGSRVEIYNIWPGSLLQMCSATA
uniref:Galectin n=1 Tax=Anolis carolinensis TaxID=28377 RepID=A0A803SQ53_ANOCA